MRDEKKTKAQLIDELVGLRRRIAELEASEAERVQAVEALRESEEKYRQLFELESDALFLIDNETGRIVEVNAAASTLYGYGREELLQKTNTDLSAEPDETRKATVEQRTRVPVRYHRKKDGTVFPVEIAGRHFAWRGSQVHIAAIRDIAERLQAEEALRQSEQRYRDLVDNANEAIVVVQDGVVEFANLKAFEMTGYSEQDLLSKPFIEFIHPDDRSGAIERQQRRMMGQNIPFRQILRVVDRSGETKWVESDSIIIDWEGRPAVLSFIDDISERRRAEEALRLTQFSLDRAGDPAFWMGPDARFFYVNEAACYSLGYSREELLSMTVHDMDPHFPKEVWQEHWREVKQRGTFTLESRHRTKDGRIFPVEITVNYLEFEGREYNFAFARDITERKQAEETLRKSEERLRLILQNMPVLMDAFDENFSAVVWNRECERVTGYTASEMVGNPRSLELLVPDAEYREQMAAEMARRGNDYRDWEWDIVAKDGSPKTIAWSNISKEYPISGWSGWGIGVDVTERKRAEKALRDSNRRLEETLAELRETQERMVQQERLAAVGQLAAGIAHDFNNILASIVLYTQMSLRTPDVTPKTRERLEAIARQVQHGTDLVQQILDFGRRTVLERRPLDLRPFLEEVVGLLKRTLPENIRIDLACGRGEHIIHADPMRVQQALVNMALNARDAMPEGGELRIGLDRSRIEEGGPMPLPDMQAGEWVQVTVTDTGTGIPPKVLPHIFEPFFTTKAPLGHGLGLAQVYGIVKQHEGHIGAETQVGKGTTFTFYFPMLAIAQPEPPIQEMPALVQGSGELILVVEDDPAMRAALVDVLDMLNYKVLEAANGREAVAVVEQHHGDISLVLSDWVMPLMGGLELVRELQQRRLSAKVLMLTGHPLDRTTKSKPPEGVVGWVQKPPSLDQLAEAVAQALREP